MILAEHGNFPSDNHIVDSVARLLGKKARFVPAGEIATAVDADTGVATLSHVNYRSAEVQDMAAVTKAAHAKGALIIWIWRIPPARSMCSSTRPAPISRSAAATNS